jgi:1-phosphatidylinositol-4-phosphate 5-kinase
MLSSLLKGNFHSLKELISSGKSGSFFYYSMDGKYTLKTIPKNEKNLLKDKLKDLYYHLE